MKNYELIINTLNTAETMLRDYTEVSNKEIADKSADALTQIAQYLWEQLKNADFTEFQACVARWSGRRDEGIPFGQIEVHSHKKGYLVNHVEYDAQLYINADYIACIYFNDSGYIFTGKYYKPTLLFLCYKWKELKAEITRALDNAMEDRNKKIKSELNELNMQKYIVNNFEL